MLPRVQNIEQKLQPKVPLPVSDTFTLQQVCCGKCNLDK
jgi:hypothetical protein